MNPAPLRRNSARGGRIVTRKLLTGLIAVALLAVAVGIYADAMDNEFIWDDPIIFKRQLPYFDSFSNVFFPPKSIPQFGGHYYRPLTIVSYQLDEWISKTYWPETERERARQLVYHSSVVIYHGITTMLVLLLGLSLVRVTQGTSETAWITAVSGGLLFAAHPIHVESVAWMAGRTDVICALFFVGATLFYLNAKRSGRLWSALMAALLALGAMLAKETGAGLVLLLPMIDLLWSDQRVTRQDEELTRAERRRRAREKRSRPLSTFTPQLLARWASLAVALLIYLGLRQAALQTMGSPALEATIRLDALFGSLGWLVRKAVWPLPQSAFVHEIPGGAYMVVGLLAAAGFAAAVWLAFKHRARHGWRAEILALSVFFTSAAPSQAIALFRISETPLAERYLYIPTVGSCLLVGLLLARLVRLLPAGVPAAARWVGAAIVTLVLVTAATTATISRSSVWRNDLGFWQDTVTKAQDQGLPHLHLGIRYAEMGYKEQALEQYGLAFEKYDDAEGRSKALNNMGSILLSMGRYEEAVEKLQRALQEVRNYPTAYYNLGVAHMNLANRERNAALRDQLIRQSISEFERALQLNPRYVKAHLQYGSLLTRIGQADKGAQHLQRVIELASASSEAQQARRLLAR
ncbi:MAG: tetratricopeptide repeat protein [Acidobacteriota bacterium]|nr:MAG: tetratricopeptide repeat protein [Acidobacteriota bacterium]